MYKSLKTYRPSKAMIALPTTPQSLSFIHTKTVHHECILFPSYAFRDPNGSKDWIIRIRGWTLSLTKPGPKQKLLKGITKSVAGKSANNDISNQMFEHRFKYFLANGKKNQTFRVEAVGSMPFDEWKNFDVNSLPVNPSSKTNGVSIKSENNGVFLGELHVRDDQVQSWTGNKHINILKIKAEQIKSKGHISSYGSAQLIEPYGISVISDIDDTIKETRVLSGARAVLLSTFFNPSRAIEGMAETYTHWYNSGAAFHYVSSCPIQLAQVLKQFIRNHRFPPGSFHLRPSNGLLSKIIETSKRSKYESICGILKDFPNRKFILVGDSSEIDLEIYTQIATEHPGQIINIFIRDVTGQKRGQRKSPFNTSLPHFFTSNNDNSSSVSSIESENSEFSEQENTGENNDDSVQDAATGLAGLVLETSLTGHPHVGDTIHSLKEGHLKLQDLTDPTSVPIIQLQNKVKEAQKLAKDTGISVFKNGKDLYLNNRKVLDALKNIDTHNKIVT